MGEIIIFSGGLMVKVDNLKRNKDSQFIHMRRKEVYIGTIDLTKSKLKYALTDVTGAKYYECIKI